MKNLRHGVVFRTARLFLAGIALGALAIGCGGGPDDGSGGGSGGGWPGAGRLPAELQGGWYAGRGGTSAPYDATTGTWGTPSGTGLAFIFEGDGRYTKAFQSYEAAGGCTIGYTAFETGTASVAAASLEVRPDAGHILHHNGCTGAPDTRQPLSELHVESFSWQLQPDELDPSQTVLLLTAADGASAIFKAM